MTELEKFKRRMIRMMARLQVQEKKPEDELWEYLQKQTKCDCKWLWERMRALTLKRLKRLLIAEDKQDNIAAIARMSLTDWLLFDCILVHEKIDVIGMELMAEGRRTEPRPIFDLFSLVQKFELEGQRGEDLARAWTAATVSYNSGGRQCSPMLLQLRWYQLKEVTRQKFYNFWFTYRGSAKLLPVALKDKPTRLQTAVAKRYPHIITTPFLKWQDLIEERLIIMPDEFEIQMKTRSGHLPKPIEENDADLVLMEPEIETIDLGVDSDSDHELRDEVEGSKARQMIADEDAAAVNSITLKQEPTDEDQMECVDIDPDHLQNIDSEIEGIEALQNIDIPFEENIADDRTSDTDAIDFTENESRGSAQEETATSNENEIPTSENRNLTDLSGVSSPTPLEITPLPQEDEKLREETMVPLTPSGITMQPVETTSVSINEISTETISPIAAASKTIKEIPEVHLTSDSDENVETESELLPQIENVFGNVNIPDAELLKLSNYLETTKSNSSVTEEQNIDDEFEDDIIKTEITDVSCEEENIVKCETDGFEIANLEGDKSNKSETNITEERPQDNLYCDDIPGLNFEDDGIEFIDEGIVEEEDVTLAKDFVSPDLIKKEASYDKEEEASCDKEKEVSESQTIDLKLLMVPVVYTKKLEHMKILKDKPVNHVNDKEIINLISVESKPVSENLMQIQEDQPVKNTMSDDEEDAHDDLFDQPQNDNETDSDTEDEDSESIPENKKVSESSVLFQKPRNREYGPLVVCKNPDFNTRLKRLTVGFLSHTRNRSLLRECKPLTIDLCKAFESKLVDNVIYFKESPTTKVVFKKEKPDEVDENRQTPPAGTEENVAQAVVPTTNSVQNIIHNLHNDQLLPQPEYNTNKQFEEKDAVVERNKTIVLPNIDNVRRINQKLLVAEVSPMRVEHSNTNYAPPVSLVSRADKNIQEQLESLARVKPSNVKNPAKEITGGTVMISGQVIDGVTNKVTTHCNDLRNNRPKTRPLPWRPIDRARVGFWNNSTTKKRENEPKWVDEQLLTVDTLNKILHVVQPGPVYEVKSTGKKKKAKTTSKESIELQRKVTEVQKMLTREHNYGMKESTDKSSDAELKRAQPNLKKPERKRMKTTKYGTHCCWVRFKQLHPNCFNKHPCGNHCICCCGENKTEAETDRKVCESIESVIEQSLEIVENECFENNYLKNKATMDIDPDNIVQNNDEIDVPESNTNIIPVENKIADNIIAIDSDEPNSDENITIDTRDVHALKNDVKNDNVIEENNVVENNIVVKENPAKIYRDCVVIETDEPVKQLPPQVAPLVKINISFQQQKENRKRGRPLKYPIAIHDKLQTKVTIKPAVATRHSARIARARRSSSFGVERRNILPIEKEKDTETDNRVLFLNSNHISGKQNHPIFLGKNKILLTDVALPRNKDKQIENMSSPALVNTSLPLPQGVNLLMLPNGTLTCTTEPNVELSPEEISVISAIIENVQKQINCALSNSAQQSVHTIQPLPTTKSSPTLQLIPGEVPQIAKDNNEIVNLTNDENSADPPLDNNSIAPVEQASIADISVNPTLEPTFVADSAIGTVTEGNNMNSDEVKQKEFADAISGTKKLVLTTEHVPSTAETEVSIKDTTIPINDSVALSLEIPSISDNHLNQHILEPAVISDPVNNTVTDSNITDSDKGDKTVSVGTNIENNELDSEKAESESESIGNKTTLPAESESIGKKTILSDLMEMSGIFEEDIAPAVETAPQIVDVDSYTPEATSGILPPQLDNSAANYGSPPVVADSLPELSPITSFQELKYACANNGNFFKLDLETKSLTPINVCIKKNQRNVVRPNQFVDLTDDADDAESEVNKNGNILESNAPKINKNDGISVNIDNRDVRPSVTNNRSLLKNTLAKPLKLFKVVHPFANVNLFKKVEKGELNDFEDSIDSVSVIRTKKRSRKQDLKQHTYENQFLNFLSSDCEKEDYEFDGSFEEIEYLDDSDSSDDEPLARKVRRKEEKQNENEKMINLEAAETPSTSVNVNADSVNEPEINEAPTVIEDEEDKNENNELPNEEIEEPELQFISEHDEEEDDCILGV